MKHVVMLFALLLTFGLLVACGKDDPDDLYNNPGAGFNKNNDNSNSNDSIQYPTYEANWVLDRQVIDKTVMRNINNQRLEIAHMPKFHSVHHHRYYTLSSSSGRQQPKAFYVSYRLQS